MIYDSKVDGEMARYTACTHDKFERDFSLDGELLNFWALYT